MTQPRQTIIIPVTFLWIGFVCAISFLEAWLKFQAPGVTLQIGLSIGQLVFRALNKIELVFALGLLISLVIARRASNLPLVFFGIAFAILMAQTFWLLPTLSDRAKLTIEGLRLPSSRLHFYYVALEFLKVFALFCFGVLVSKKENNG
jgi:hypothetical protein